MSIWKEIKRAINSTLGTSDFKPLDQIITDGKGLVASDNLYYQLNSATMSSEGSATRTINTATMHASGSMRAKAKASMYGTYSMISLYVYKNGTLYTSQTWNNRGGDSVEKSVDISFKKDDVLRFDVAFSSITSTSRLYDIGLYADVKDISGITVT